MRIIDYCNQVTSPNIPWEEKSKDCQRNIWRYSNNPIIERDEIPSSNSIFNSAVTKFKNTFAGVFRCDNRAREMRLHVGFSRNGIEWSINPDPIQFVSEDEEIQNLGYGYDPRITFIEDRYYITWCNDYHGPTIGVAYTFDFRDFYQMENAFLPFNRNGVLFPRKINGKFFMLSRPSDNSHTAFGDIFCSQSEGLVFWGNHRHVMSPIKEKTSWQSLKIGAGSVPIETTEGWLLFYHGVLNSCNGFVYSTGAALLDLERPWIVRKRSKNYLLSPQKQYECVGDVPNVVFPCACLVEAKSGRIAVYYGAADTVTAIAFTTIEEIDKFLKTNLI